MVVLHGLGAAATPFGPVLTRLQRHARRVVAIELPGHGFSATPPASLGATELLGAMREALDAVLDEPAVVCGNSLGGAVALRYALDRPERVRGLAVRAKGMGATVMVSTRSVARVMDAKVPAATL